MSHDESTSPEGQSFGWALGRLMSRIERALYDALWDRKGLIALTLAPASDVIGLLEEGALLYLGQYGITGDSLPGEITRDWALRQMEIARNSEAEPDGMITETMIQTLFCCAEYRRAASDGELERATALAMNALWSWRVVIPTLEEYAEDEQRYAKRRAAGAKGGRARAEKADARRDRWCTEYQRLLHLHRTWSQRQICEKIGHESNPQRSSSTVARAIRDKLTS